MTEIMDLLLNTDIIKIAFALTVYIITHFIKKILPQNKTLKTVIIPFILGIILLAYFFIFM